MLELLAMNTSAPQSPNMMSNGNSQYFLLFISARHSAVGIPVTWKHASRQNDCRPESPRLARRS